MSDTTPEEVFLMTYPDVPDEQRPRELYVNYALGEACERYLAGRGWKPVDVRLMVDPAQQTTAYLQGALAGSIVLNDRLYKYLELKAKTEGLIGNKDPTDPRQTETLPVDKLLNGFGTDSAWAWTGPPKKPGRPVGAKDSTPRDKAGYQELRGVALEAKQRAEAREEDND